jgi:hypothetical protein
MTETHVISALRAKRAEILGEILAIQTRALKLRDDLASIDRAIRVFDPTIHVGQIRPVRKRKAARQFRHGECSRTILDMLRRAPSPMTAPEIAEKLTVECRLMYERQPQ